MRLPASLSLALVLCLHVGNAKMFTPCELLKDLEQARAPRSFIGNWICLVRSTSFFNSSFVTDLGYNNQALGLFQLHSYTHCRYKEPGGRCNMRCENLINDDIVDDFKCAHKMFNEDGWQWWPAWVRMCKKNPTATALPVCRSCDSTRNACVP